MKLALLMCVLLVGCSATSGLIKPSETVHWMSITWERGIIADCVGSLAPPGCAMPTAAGCTITMPEDATDAVVAEEFRHCFGYIHKRGDGG